MPLILWAFAMLNYNPLVAVLAALDQQVEQMSSQITAQVPPEFVLGFSTLAAVIFYHRKYHVI